MTEEEIPDKVSCPACHRLFARPHKHVMDTKCKNKISENMIHDLKIIEDKKNAINQRLRDEKKRPSSQPPTKAPTSVPVKKATSPKPSNNTESQPVNKAQSSKKPPKKDPIDMLSSGHCPACEKPFKHPVQHINHPKSKCKGQVSPTVILQYQALQKEKQNKDRAERNATRKKDDLIGFKEDQSKRQAESDAKKRKNDPVAFKESLNSRVQKHRSKTLQKLKKDINEDTGMEVKCCSCLELKSKRSCVSIRTLSEEMILKYCYQDEVARSVDGKFYVCLTCQTYIKADKGPPKAVKEIFGLLDFPTGER